MEPRFFFSTDGKDMHGPVTVAALRQLFADGALNEASFLCPEGDSKWQPLNPEFFATPAPAPAVSRRRGGSAATLSAQGSQVQAELAFAAAPSAPANTSVAAPPTAPAFAPPPPLETPAELSSPAEPPAVLEVPTEVGQIPEAPAVAEPAPEAEAVAPAFVAPDRPTPTPPAANPLRLTEFPAARRPDIPIIDLPSSGEDPAGVVSVEKKTGRALLFSLVAAVVLVLAATAAGVFFARPFFAREFALIKERFGVGDQARIEAAADSLRTSVSTEAQKQLKTKGYYEGNPDEAAKKLQTLKDQVGNGNSDFSRISRDLLVVASKLLEKTQACEAAAKSCDFDPTTITGSDDVANREVAIGRLHSAQQDVVTFLQNINDYCRAELAKDNFNEETSNAAIAGFRHSGHIDLLINLWQEQAKLSSDHIARFTFLGKSWRSWKITNGQLVFQNTSDVNTYNGFVHTLQDDVTAIGDTQKQIFADQPATTDQPTLRTGP